MEYTEITIKVPVGSEEDFLRMNMNYLENYLSGQIRRVPEELDQQFKDEVDASRVANNLEVKYSTPTRVIDSEVK